MTNPIVFYEKSIWKKPMNFSSFNNKKQNSKPVYQFEKKKLVSIDINKYIYYIFGIVYKILNKFKQKEMVKSE